MFWFFGREACGILAPRPGIEPAPPALQGKVFNNGPPGKSLILLVLFNGYIVFHSMHEPQFIMLSITDEHLGSFQTFVAIANTT